MKEWWNNLALREKQMLSLGGFFLVAFFIYLLLWLPLDNKVVTLRNQIQRNQELLAWMKEADKRVQILEKTAQPKKPTPLTGSLLSIVQKQINRTPLVSSLTQLHQVDNDSVQLTFQKVDFDQLMEWLIQLSKQQGIGVTQISITPGGAPGGVAADLVLKNG
ncbi:MAG: type II secretion system protein GspM [Gammaproteobacteria bacterium]